MRLTLSIIHTILIIFIVFLLGSCEAGSLVESSYKYDPGRFEADILEFEANDKIQLPAPDGIVFVGSSSIRQWDATLKRDMSPLSVVSRGFGGSNMNDALYYIDRIVLPYNPRAIVLYEGENDVDQGVSPKVIADTYKKFVEKLRAHLPNCRVYFLSIKPTPKRWALWPKMEEANHLIAQYIEEDDLQFFVDLAMGMLDERGEPRRDIYLNDGIHMNPRGYQIWINILLPVLKDNELRFEGYLFDQG